MRKMIFMACLLGYVYSFGQTKGSIVGNVTDGDYVDTPLPFVTIFIKGTQIGCTSDFDGNFKLDNLDPGVYTIVFSSVGYATTEFPEISVEAGGSSKLNVALKSGDISLDEVVVEAKILKESEASLILVQRKSVDIVQSIGSQELSRKGVSDAVGAVTKITGISKQEGAKNVFVRGLGDRYNSTSLNGLPLPSEDPEYKNISLDFFSTNIISSIDINKTFSNQLYGDEAGANINIFSKKLNEEKSLDVKVSTGINSLVASQNGFLRTEESNYLGITDRKNPITDLGTYSFKNGLDPIKQSSAMNSSGSLSFGRQMQVGSNKVSVYLVGSTDSDYSYRKGLNRGAVSSNGGFGQDFSYQKYVYTANQILMANLRMDFDENNYLAYNSLFIHDNTQSVGEYRGYAQNISEVDGRSAFLRRQQVNDNSLFVNQLLGHYEINNRLSTETGVSYNVVTGSEPDRRTNTFILMDESGTYLNTAGSAGVNHRFFSELQETEMAGFVKVDFKLFSNSDNKSKIQVGYNYRDTQRDFSWRQFGHDFSSQSSVDITNLSGSVFNQQSVDDGRFALVTNWGRGGTFDVLKPETYNGSRQIHAPFASMTYIFSPAFTVNVGVRYEVIEQQVTWDTGQLPNKFGQNVSSRNPAFALPSFTLKYNISDDNIVRLSGSKTYTFPQFKELAPFLYEDVNFFSFGNPDLLPTENYNADLKFEKYLKKGELIAVTGFYKYVDNAINRTLVVSAANELSYVNTGQANAYGVEVEARKSVFQQDLGETYRSINVGFNLSYLHTEAHLNDTDTDNLDVQFTNNKSKLEGASPLLINTDLTYVIEQGGSPKFLGSMVLNYFSSRVYSLGTVGRQNIMERGIPTLDLVTKYNFSRHSQIGVTVKNILNPDHRLSMNTTEGNVIIENYNLGINASISYSYNF